MTNHEFHKKAALVVVLNIRLEDAALYLLNTAASVWPLCLRANQLRAAVMVVLPVVSSDELN